jgi:sugar O-acyltransferase (sialic acid O-acetyltransferase NeuD family)
VVQPIVIFGAGGFAREVLALLRDINAASNRWEVLGFIDDDANIAGEVRDGIEVLGGRDWLDRRDVPVHLALGTGSPSVNRKLVADLERHVAGFPSLIHPSAVLTEHVRVGRGVVITAGNILTSQIAIDDFAMLNLACTVGHDVRIGRYVTVSPGCNISGNVVIREGCDVGTGTQLLQGVSVGEWSIIGAGAVVAKDLPANCTAVGVPARSIKERPAGWYNE